MAGFGEGLAAWMKFTTWFVPVAGILALWKMIDIAIWLFHHVIIH